MEHNDELVAAVIEKSKMIDGKRRLSCAQAFELARQFDAKIVKIGLICNRQGIKIINCQLGCFK
jgi:hypothetical protein